MPKTNPAIQAPLTISADYRRSPLIPILDLAVEGIALVEPGTWRITYANPTLRKWSKMLPVGELASTISDLLLTEGTVSVLEQIESAWRRNELDITLEAKLLFAGRAGKPVALQLCRLPLADGPLLGLIVHEVLAVPADTEPTSKHRDALTGLPDRTFLLSRMTALMEAESTGDRQFAVLFVDLDNFKQVNDTHGHLVGDRVLSAAARRLSDSVRDGDHVVRYGGDEFVLLMERVASQSDIEPLVSRIHSVLAEVISLQEGDFTLSVSVGAALASQDHKTPEDLLAAADRAMYAAKRLNA